MVTGTLIGPYAILSPLGAGGMGEVYRARDTRLDRDVAIKVLPAGVRRATRIALRAVRARGASGRARSIHPNILAIYDFGARRRRARTSSSELLEGETLRDALAGGALPPRKAVDYAHADRAAAWRRRTRRASSTATSSPRTCSSPRDGRVKILDFGLAQARTAAAPTAAQSLAPTLDGGDTTPGIVLGTVGYMSPEQVRGEAGRQRAPTSSLRRGALRDAVRAARVQGRDRGRDDDARSCARIRRSWRPPRPAPPPALERIVRRCLEKNRAERFRSAQRSRLRA